MGMGIERDNHTVKALNLLRSRISDFRFIFNDSQDGNYSKLKFMLSSSVTEACNNSILLLGPRGCGKQAVLELVIQDLLLQYPDSISAVRLNGLLHSDDISAFKEIARQLCMEHQLLFSKTASFDDNSQFMVAVLKECGLAHKTVIFILDEFDLFAQGKQRLLYSLLDAMQSVASQAVVLGISCRLDADQLLEKRVRSRFSHRKLLFLPPSIEDSQKLLVHMLTLPIDSSFPHDYAVEFNRKVQNIVEDRKFKETFNQYLTSDSSVKHLLRFIFYAVSHMDLQTGFLSQKNFETAFSSIQRQPKLESLKSFLGNFSLHVVETIYCRFHLRELILEKLSRQYIIGRGECIDCSILELYILVCMKRLEVKEQSFCNFNSIMKEYKSIHDSFQTSDYYARNVCLRAFEHLMYRELICFTDNRGHNLSVEFRPVKLLISSAELHQGLRTYHSCPAILQKLIER